MTIGQAITDATDPVTSGIVDPRNEMGNIGIGEVSVDYIRNQAAHWAGGCAYDRRARERASCWCGNCGGYRLFVAALTKAYAMGRADEIVDGLIRAKAAGLA